MNTTTALTSRQYDCLYYLMKGMTAKQIGDMLGISYRTVQGHYDRLRQKFKCRNRSELLLQALRTSYVKKKLLLDLNEK